MGEKRIKYKGQLRELIRDIINEALEIPAGTTTHIEIEEKYSDSFSIAMEAEVDVEVKKEKDKKDKKDKTK